MKRLNVQLAIPYPGDKDGCCSAFVKGGDLTCIVTMSTKNDKGLANARAALMFHEAVHVWQHLRDEMGEKNPSAEFEAYAI